MHPAAIDDQLESQVRRLRSKLRLAKDELNRFRRCTEAAHDNGATHLRITRVLEEIQSILRGIDDEELHT